MIAQVLLCAATMLCNAAPEAQTTPPAQPAPDLLPVEQNIIHLTNSERARYGLPPLEMDPELMQSARQHTVWMTSYESLTHSRGPVAENIAMGQADSGQALRSWMNSSGHRANILNGSHRKIGVAAYFSPSGRIFWCQQFRW